MKKYVALKMLKNSCFLEFYQTLDKDTQENINNRIDELVKNESKY